MKKLSYFALALAISAFVACEDTSKNKNDRDDMNRDTVTISVDDDAIRDINTTTSDEVFNNTTDEEVFGTDLDDEKVNNTMK
jgi:hypothetical protein